MCSVLYTLRATYLADELTTTQGGGGGTNANKSRPANHRFQTSRQAFPKRQIYGMTKYPESPIPFLSLPRYLNKRRPPNKTTATAANCGVLGPIGITESGALGLPRETKGYLPMTVWRY